MMDQVFNITNMVKLNKFSVTYYQLKNKDCITNISVQYCALRKEWIVQIYESGLFFI